MAIKDGAVGSGDFLTGDAGADQLYGLDQNNFWSVLLLPGAATSLQ